MRKLVESLCVVALFGFLGGCGSDDDDDVADSGQPDGGSGDPDTGADNQPPVIASLEADREAVRGGATATITVQADDPDGDPLELSWTASMGTLDAETGAGPVVWTAPMERGTATITVSASDGRGGTDEQAIDVAVLGWAAADGTGDLPPGAPLKNVSFLTADEGWAVGGDEVDNTPYVFHFQNAGWIDETPGNFGHLHGLVVLAANDVWTVGGEGLGYHQDGLGWEAIQLPGGCVHGLDFSAPDDGWATPAHGQVGMRHYKGGAYGEWEEADVPSNDGIDAVSMLSETDGFAVGAGGRIFQLNGREWSEVASPVNSALHGIDLVDATDGWAVGDGGTIVRFDGDDWSASDSATDEALHAVRAFDGENVWAVGDAGVILFFDGTAWTETPSSTDRDLFGVFATGPSDAWAVGADGTILHFE